MQGIIPNSDGVLVLQCLCVPGVHFQSTGKTLAMWGWGACDSPPFLKGETPMRPQAPTITHTALPRKQKNGGLSVESFARNRCMISTRLKVF